MVQSSPLTLLANFLLRWILLTSFLFRQVSLRYYDKIEIRVNRFSNPGNKIASSGECCDGRRSNLSSCSNGCDTYFVVCIDRPGNSFPSTSCLQKNHSRIFTNSSDFRSTFNTSKPDALNLVLIKYLPFWPLNISFTLIFYDDDRLPGDTFKGDSKTSEIIIMHSFVSPILPSKEWTFRNYSKNGVTFEYLYRLTCDEYYYGDSCNRYCEERDDKYGHYVCLPNGTRMCRSGYTGKTCKNPICSQSCKPNGKCTAPNICSCSTGWAGPNCQRCIPSPKCVHATCTKPGGKCICKSGWTGQNCNADKRYCSNYLPCKNNATCYNYPSVNYTCTCQPGYEGKNCEKNKRYCSNYHPCKNNATCHNNASINYTCTCEPGYEGKNCEKKIKYCFHYHPCKNNATCYNNASINYTCACQPGYEGKNCEKNKRYCSNYHPCKNNATCHNNASINYTCTCEPGYEGKNCEKNKRYCSNYHPCKNNATCHNNASINYTCTCEPGYEGKNCEKKIKYCFHYHPCKNNATCYNNASINYTCACQPGYEGKNCEKKIKYCCHYLPCKNNATCYNNASINYTCACQPGYEGKNCEKIRCPPMCNLTKAECHPVIGCKCHPGWKGPDCNQCTTLHNCANGYCIKPFECLCYDDWTGSLCNISKKWPCNKDRPCQNNGVCKSSPNGTKKCVCEEGFTGERCENVRCPPTCHLTNADCHPVIGCKCLAGWKGPDCNQCIILHDCANGYCIKPFECLCHEDWTGTLCNISKKWPCNKDRPCQNNGVCKSSPNGTKKCVCEEGFTGERCENGSSPGSKNNRGLSNLSTTLKDSSIIAIFVSVGLFICVIFICAMLMLWRNLRRRMSFCVTRPESFVINNGFKQSYKFNDVKLSENFNNNLNELSPKSDSQSIVMNPMTTSEDGQKGLWASKDFHDEGGLPNSCVIY